MNAVEEVGRWQVRGRAVKICGSGVGDRCWRVLIVWSTRGGRRKYV
jgi:hypothetical protein